MTAPAREYPIPIPYDRIAAFCRKNRIRKLSLFGSILRDDFTPKSDVDVLVEFEEGATPGLEFFDMQRSLTRILRRKVDLNTEGDLSKYFRARVLAAAEPLYERA
jgi:predicted nucleotidyltransferase